jgi:hypothetical protein
LNKNIRIKKNTVKWVEWHKHGINIINDLVDKYGIFITAASVENKYGVKCNMLAYNALKDAIPFNWRKILKLERVDMVISFKDDLRINIGKKGKKLKDITIKELYWTLISKIRLKPNFFAKMKMELGIAEQEWEDIFVIPSCITLTKIRAFQYKLLFGLLPCNLYLKRIKRSDTDRCMDCNEIDDTAHYLFECPRVVPFWNNFMDWWNAMTNSVIYLDKRSALTGFVGPQDIFQTLNACLLLAKWHVYKRNLDESEVFFHNYLCELKYNLDSEKTIAIRNNKLQRYINRWQIVEDYIT